MSEAEVFRGKVGLQQRVLPDYRAAFFERLAAVSYTHLTLPTTPYV